MSKSRGNGIDPLELIADYGADGMRFGLALQVTGSQDMKFDREKLSSSRNFATKLWNAARFVMMNLEDFDLEASCAKADQTATAQDSIRERVVPLPVTDADRWILSRLASLTVELDEGWEEFDFGGIARALYRFFWNEFCDWYIEFAKGQLAEGGPLRSATQRNLVFVLDSALRFLHPFMPFLTEKIWLSLPHGDTHPSLMVAQWPSSESLLLYKDREAERIIEMVCSVITSARSTRARYHIASKEGLDVIVHTTGEYATVLAEKLLEQKLLIENMANTASLTISADAEKPDQVSVTIAPEFEVFVILEGLVDFEKERARLIEARNKAEGDLAKLDRKLSNEGFLKKAVPEIIEKTKLEAADAKTALEQIELQLTDLD